MTATEFVQWLLTAVGFLGLSGAAAWAAVTFLGKRWIESKFEERMAGFKHAQAIELARMRVDIEAMLAGAVKLQSAEFEMLPAAWSKLVDAYNEIAALVHPFQSFPDVDRMSPQQLEEFLEASKLRPSEKDRLQGASDKIREYQNIIFQHRASEVRKSFFEFRNYVIRNAPFFPPELKDSFVKAANGMWSALISKEAGREADDWDMQRESWKELDEVVKPLYESVEKAVQARLQGHGRAAPPSPARPIGQ